MTKVLQNFCSRALFIVLGCIWFLMALFFLSLTMIYLAEGAGLQLFGFSALPGSLFIGWIHVMGFLIAGGISFAIGVGLCVFGRTKINYRPTAAASR
jgi:hypothetical protein